ncbi:methyltransferase domain-containing protein [Streptomyces sp. NPDC058001]|uniref:methyltransferase domain-containing protein n=1 Tax=Streptomyces sp. NPDC058001 TaxID=3346300 RepID=UPI0036F07187
MDNAGPVPMFARLDSFERLPEATELRHASYELLRAAPGDRVLDVGCGTGLAVAELLDRGVRAVGVDHEPGALESARHRIPGADLRVGDAEDLPFPDGTFHACRADKVLHELADPARAVAEMRRVVRPGGRVVLVGQDWEALVIDSDRPEVTRALVRARADRVPAPTAARRFRALLVDAGFADVAVGARTLVLSEPEPVFALGLLRALAAPTGDSGPVPPDDVTAWLAEQEARARDRRLFLAVPFFLASGRVC